MDIQEMMGLDTGQEHPGGDGEGGGNRQGTPIRRWRWKLTMTIQEVVVVDTNQGHTRDGGGVNGPGTPGRW
jgi:hypothetical protein